MSPVTIELSELSPALLQPQDTVMATLGELPATLPSQEEELMPKGSLHSQLKGFRTQLRAAKRCFQGIWSLYRSSSDPVRLISLSWALAAWQSTPWITWVHVTMVVSKWQGSVDERVDRGAQLARAATQLRNACREAATKVVNMEATATARARELQDEAARDGTAQENMVELGLALGGEEVAKVVARHEAQVRREARVAASEATRATMVRQWLEVAQGLLERLVAACAEATAFPRELVRRVGDIKAALKGTNEVSPTVPEALVAKVAVAEQLWEANARLAKDHLEGTLGDTNKFYINGDPANPSACGVPEQCQRAMEDIPRLLPPMEHPQGVPLMSMELQKLLAALPQPQVTVVAILGKLLATLPSGKKEMLLFMPKGCLYLQLEGFSTELQAAKWGIQGLAKQRSSSEPFRLVSLSGALAAYKSTALTTWINVTVAACQWQESVDELVDRWAQLAWAATQLRNTCREAATKANMEARATARARELQDEAARDGTAQENMVELGLALGGEEGAEVVAEHEAWVRREARVAASEATRATMVRQQLEVALGLLERLVAACDEATAFLQQWQCRVGDIRASLVRTNEASRNVLKDLVAKVAEAEQLWSASAFLVKSYLLGTVRDILGFYFGCGPASPSQVAKQCREAIKAIPWLLRSPERPRGVPSDHGAPKAVPSPAAATGHRGGHPGELLATLPTQKEMELVMPTGCLYRELEEFTRDPWAILYSTDGTCWHHNVTCDDNDPFISLGQALDVYKSTPMDPLES